MKLDKICRACLGEKSELKPLFNTCLPSMLMACSSIQVIEGDGLPNQLCTQCLQTVNKAYTFKRLCEKSDVTLRNYVNSINLESIALSSDQPLLDQIKTNHFFNNAESSIFSDIFGTANATLVDNFASQNSNAVTDLAETIQNLQTIAEQCLPETWTNSNMISNSGDSTTCQSVAYPKCHLCDRIFQDEWSLSEHIKIHSEDLPTKEYTTTFLENQFLLEPTTTTLETTSLQNLMANTKVKKYTCQICDKSFTCNKSLTVHLRVHTGEKPLSCGVCGKAFAIPSSLQKHKQIHTSEKNHTCPVCGHSFRQVSNLNAHLRSHTGEKPHKCSICGKGCTTNRHLSTHLRTHTGEKPFKCTECTCCFSTDSQLKKHMLRHTGEKPFKCWQCGKSFRHKDTCEAHIRCHLGERPYACNLCGKRYITSSHLRVHMKTHVLNHL